jgi:hypothetical protein
METTGKLLMKIRKFICNVREERLLAEGIKNSNHRTMAI